jgi:spoIIIJ-associated protein
VLDSGNKGLFGLGFRQARVRLTIKQASDKVPARLVEAQDETPAESAAAAPAVPVAAPVVASEAVAASPTPVSPTGAGGGEVDAPDENMLNVARDTVEELVKAMKVHARVTVQRGRPEDPQDRIPVQVDIRGDDLSILIGPKAETLNALQYIAGLIISKEIGHSIPLVVDVEGYRVRRSQQIRQLARRMAEQATRTGRRQVLEPMPASERRLVHIELRDHANVSTESVGEEPRRKVTIVPK